MLANPETVKNVLVCIKIYIFPYSMSGVSLITHMGHQFKINMSQMSNIFSTKIKKKKIFGSSRRRFVNGIMAHRDNI